MTSKINISVGGLTSVKQFTKSDQEVGQVIRWFVADKIDPPPDGLTQAQLNQYYLDFARDEIVRYVQREARHNRVKELRAQQQNVEDQASGETEL